MTKVRDVQLLLVEDNPNDIELTLRALSKHHLSDKVHVVKDGEEAIEFLFAEGRYTGQETTSSLKAVLLDLKLPRMNGLEVLRKIKADEKIKVIPVVVSTSSQEPSDLKECYEMGVNSYLVKPIDFESFVKAVSEAGLYWLLLNKAVGAK